MDKKTKNLDRQFVVGHLTVKTYPKPGWDIYEVRIYYKGAYLASVEVDGLELECWRHKDADEMGFTKIENHPLVDEVEDKKEWN